MNDFIDGPISATADDEIVFTRLELCSRVPGITSGLGRADADLLCRTIQKQSPQDGFQIFLEDPAAGFWIYNHFYFHKNNPFVLERYRIAYTILRIKKKTFMRIK